MSINYLWNSPECWFGRHHGMVRVEFGAVFCLEGSGTGTFPGQAFHEGKLWVLWPKWWQLLCFTWQIRSLLLTGWMICWYSPGMTAHKQMRWVMERGREDEVSVLSHGVVFYVEFCSVIFAEGLLGVRCSVRHILFSFLRNFIVN